MSARRSRKQQHWDLLRASRHLYEPLLELQGGKCALCDRKPKNRKLDLDHDHKTMKIRGLLCVSCNQNLRNRLTPAWLRAAADYLEHPPAELLPKEQDAQTTPDS